MVLVPVPGYHVRYIYFVSSFMSWRLQELFVKICCWSTTLPASFDHFLLYLQSAMLSRLLIRKRLLIGSKRLRDPTSRDAFHGIACTGGRRSASTILPSPKLALINHYGMDAKKISVCFSDTFIYLNGRTWWTCSFSDPNGTAVYTTTHLPEEAFGKSIEHEDGKIYFSRLKSAQNGASQRAIESLGIQVAPLPANVDHQEGPGHVNMVDERSNNEQELSTLLAAYSRNIEEYYDATGILLNEEEWWTCSFQSPLNGEKHYPVQLSTQWGPTLTHEGFLFYRNPETARHAVTLAALLSINATLSVLAKAPTAVLLERQNGKDGLNTDYPSLLPLLDEQGSVFMRSNDSSESKLSGSMTGLLPSLGSTVEAIQLPALLKDEKQPKEDNIQFGVVYVDDDDDEEYTIHFTAPTPSAEAQSASFRTLDRIMEAWFGRTAISPGNGQGSDHMPLLQNPSEQRNQILKEARQWFNGALQPKKSEKWWLPTFTHSHNFASTTAANRILQALSTANKISPCPEIEETAQTIFDFILESEEKPDIETYHAFFGCLDCEKSPVRKAKKIGQYLKTLQNSNSACYPKPNGETINFAIQAWSQVGGKIATEAIEKLMRSELTTSLPTRAIYISLLVATGAKESPSGGVKSFNPEHARDIIEQMQALSTEMNDESLIPDTEIWNVPIVSNSFYNHEILFSNGFLEKDDKLWEDALRIENWVKEMDQGANARIRPNVATYEAIIQAWIKTGTEVGLEKAESWAQRLLDVASPLGPIKPRLQTFHPILAAHAFTGQLTQLEVWIGRLTGANASCQPDCRVRGLEITAHVNAMKQKIRKIDSSGVTDSELTHHAEACSRLLRDFTTEVFTFYKGESRNSLFLEVEAFLETAQAWECLAHHRSAAGGDVDYCVQRALEVQELHSSITRRLEMIDVNYVLSAHVRQQVDHLRFNAVQLNKAILRVFIDTISNDKEPYFLKHINVVDAMLRTAAAYGHVFHTSSTRQHYAGEVVYPDLFSYHPNAVKLSYDDSVIDFCTEVANLSQIVSAAKHPLDKLIPLCALVLQLATPDSTSNESKSALAFLYNSIGEVFSVVEPKEERAALLHNLVAAVKMLPSRDAAIIVDKFTKVIGRMDVVRQRHDSRIDEQRKPRLSFGGVYQKHNMSALAEEPERPRYKAMTVGGGVKRISKKAGMRSRSRISSPSSA